MKRIILPLLLLAAPLFAPTPRVASSAKTATSAATQDALPDLVAATKPAVVLITTFDRQGDVDGYATGFFITPTLVVTNRHVTQEVHAARLTTHAGATLYANMVDEVGGHDIALLHVNTPSHDTLTLATETPRIGEKIFVVGNPRRLGWTVSEGIVAAYRASGELMQISADVSAGSSGSPVLDMKGRVVGIISSTLEEGQRLNFAVPAPLIDSAIKRVRSKAPPALMDRRGVVVTVDPSRMVNGWIDAGVHVWRGQHLKITAIGQMKMGDKESSPAGISKLVDVDKLMRREPTGALIAVIGSDNDEFFIVGEGREIYAPRSGRLFLGVNAGDLRRLSGAYSVLIKTDNAPE